MVSSALQPGTVRGPPGHPKNLIQLKKIPFMKISKSILTGMIAVGLASAASATQYTVHIVGSTAYRAPVMSAILDYLTSVGTTPKYCFWGSSTFRKANAATFSSTVGSDTYVVECFWTGSAAGVTDLVKANPVDDFLSYSTYSSSMSTTGYYISSSSPTFETAVAPDSAMSDSYYQSVAKVMSDASVVGSSGSALAHSINSATLTNAGVTAGPKKTVGIIPFLWVLQNPGSSGVSATNITQNVAKQLLQVGYINFSQLSGLSADITNYAFLVGRNEDSGTRIDSAADAQDGFDIAPFQVLPEFTSNATTSSVYPLPAYPPSGHTGGAGSTLSSIELWPAGVALNTEPGISWAAGGHSGLVSGGDVANTLNSTNPGAANITVDDGSGNVTDDSAGNNACAPLDNNYTAGSSQCLLLGYVGVADAYGVLASIGGTAIAGQPSTAKALGLSYEGVNYSPAAVENGEYTLFGYEHMYYTTATGTVKTVLDGIADKVYGSDADIDSSGNHGAGDAAGIFYSSMNFSRGLTEGGILSPTN